MTAGPAADGPPPPGRAPLAALDAAAPFAARHVGPRPDEVAKMLEAVGYADLDALVAAAVPAAITAGDPLALPPATDEAGVAFYTIEEVKQVGLRQSDPGLILGRKILGGVGEMVGLSGKKKKR